MEEIITDVKEDITLSQIHLICNMVNSKKVITFCRFLRLNDGVGYNVDAGLGHDRYRYTSKFL